MSSDVQVKVGQVWKDNDKRSLGRELTVVEIAGDYAKCKATTGKVTRVRLSRFRPTSTGYALVSDVPPGV